MSYSFLQNNSPSFLFKSQSVITFGIIKKEAPSLELQRNLLIFITPFKLNRLWRCAAKALSRICMSETKASQTQCLLSLFLCFSDACSPRDQLMNLTDGLILYLAYYLAQVWKANQCDSKIQWLIFGEFLRLEGKDKIMQRIIMRVKWSMWSI